VLRRTLAAGDGSPRVGVHEVDICGQIALSNDDKPAGTEVVIVTRGARAIGRVEIPTGGQPVCARRLREAIVDSLGVDLVDRGVAVPRSLVIHEVWGDIVRRVRATAATERPTGPQRRTVSMLMATMDRPDDLRRSLRALTAQQTIHDVEIVVVNNRPGATSTQ